MEQAGYWMWTKRKHDDLNSTHFTAANPYDDSWEEQAFAEDAAGPLGGFIWPPRSYSCSFCKREFRSAQALGGHMNVHRRDRARLKQSSSSPQNEIQHNHDHQFQKQNSNPFESLGFQYPSNNQLSTFVYNPNPKSDAVVISPSSSPSSPSRVSSAPPTQKNCPEKTFMMIPSSLCSPNVQEQQNNKKSPISSSPKSWSNLVSDKNNSTIVESACRVKAVNTDLSVSLNLVVRRTRPALSDDQEEEEANSCKRRRTEASSLLPLFLKPYSVDDDKDHLIKSSSEHKVPSPSSIEDLDLELRLGGDPPKVK